MATDARVGVKDGGSVPLIPRNTSIPTKKARYFQARDFEKNEIRLMEGESALAKDNELIRTYPLPDSLHPYQVFVVTLEMDVNCILELKVVDSTTVEIQPDDVAARTTDLEQLRRWLQGLEFSTKKTFELLRRHLGEIERNETLIALRQAEAAAQNGSPDELGAAIFRLEHAGEMLGQAMFRGDLPKGEA